MAQILMFTYALIIFFSLFLVGTSTSETPFSGTPLKTKHACEKDEDCPIKLYYLFAWCVQKLCEYH
ncbi:unnamed protein product [Trifolium pratense]|uniref:Uncharacterized protein n=1 Tax=Trifolium pratense TaxID=57577 RepID=A0ACB0KDW5_TRIPR|nr:unnamed protein product [Trifolium pratense]